MVSDAGLQSAERGVTMHESKLIDAVGLRTRLLRLEYQLETKVMGILEQNRLYSEAWDIRYTRLPALGLVLGPVDLNLARPGPSTA